METQSYGRGVAYVFFGGAFLSLGGLLVRFVEEASPWTILFYRSIVFSATVLIFMLLRDRRRTWQQIADVRPGNLLVSFLLAIGFITYVLSLFHTTVANTVLILTSGPIMAGALGFLVLGETIARITWFAMMLAVAGVVIMVSGGVHSGDVVGIVYAVVAVLSFAAYVVSIRYFGSGRDMVASTFWAGIAACVLCIPMLLKTPLALMISAHDLLMALLLGSVQVGFGFILITLGARSVPAAQIPLIGLSETALSPVWVWLVINEVPTSSTLSGGTVVLVAVAIQASVAIRASKMIGS